MASPSTQPKFNTYEEFMAHMDMNPPSALRMRTKSLGRIIMVTAEGKARDDAITALLRAFTLAGGTK